MSTPRTIWLAPLALLLLWPWLREGLDWPATVVRDLDHCPVMACDFVLYYLPQTRILYEAPGQVQPGWVYPPLLAILLQGLKPLSDLSAAWAWTLTNLAAAAGIGWLSYRQLPKGPASALLAAAMTSLSLPVLHCLKWGQVSLLIALASIVGLLRGGRLGAGLIGLAAAVKLYPAVYLVLPLLRRRPIRAAAGAAWAVGLGVALPSLMLGSATVRAFFAATLSMREVAVPGLGGQAMAPSLFRWFVDGRHIERVDQPLTDASPLLFSLPGEPIFNLLLSALIAAVSAWRLQDPQTGEPRAAALLLTGAALLLPPGWHHYFAFLPFAQACAIGGGGKAARGLAALSAALCALPVLLLPDWPDVYFVGSKWGSTTLAALLAWGALVLPTNPMLDRNPHIK